MREKHITRGFALAGVTGLALATTFLATPATARAEPAAGPSGDDIVSHTNTLTPKVKALMTGTGVAAEAKALERYWSPARMKAAKPFEKSPSMTRSGKVAKPQTQQVVPNGAPGGAEPARVSKAPKATGTKRTAPQYSQPNYPSSSPAARTNGKVFFNRNGGSYVCSAAIVNTEGKNAIWTAGHCLAEDEVWSTDVAFVPAYSDGAAPYGTWYAVDLATPSKWFRDHDWGYDVGAAILQKNSGRRIVDRLGAQGIKWNQTPKTYKVAAFGYPASPPFDGETLFRADGATLDEGDGTIYMNSGLTGGSSGGPWLRNFDGNWGHINGHNDFIYTDDPVNMYSPYYGNQVAGLYKFVRYVGAPKVTGAKPKIAGAVKVGRRVTAKIGKWKPSGTKVTYQWYRNSTKIKKATGKTYKLVKADKNRQISVMVTGTKTGYAPLTKTSAKTKKVK